MITAHFVGDKVVSASNDAFALYESSRFGEKKNSQIEYSPIEVLYLVKEKRMYVVSNK